MSPVSVYGMVESIIKIRVLTVGTRLNVTFLFTVWLSIIKIVHVGTRLDVTCFRLSYG